MPFTVAVLDEAGYGGLDPALATRLCAAAFSHRRFDVERLGDESTDVLSFEIDGPYGEMVGEVVICPACASPEMGVEELVVHGALHLSGMDHGQDFEGSEMALAEGAVMGAVRGAQR